MMYPYITLADETLITHSHLLEDGENKSVDVHFERPKPHGFDSARISLPSYKWIMRDGYSDDEIKNFEEFAKKSAHLFFKYAESGGSRVFAMERDEDEYCINIKWDAEARVWIAKNDDIPIALESGSLDALIERIKVAIPELLESNGKINDHISLSFFAERYDEIQIERQRSRETINQLHYKDYIGSVFFSEVDGVFHGKVLGLSGSLSFEGNTVQALTEDFHNAVDEYLKFCESVGKQPEKSSDNNLFNDLIEGLNEVLEYQKGNIQLKSDIVEIPDEDAFSKFTQLSENDKYLVCGLINRLL